MTPIINNRPQTDDQGKSVIKEEDHQTHSAASESQQRDDIPCQIEIEKISEARDFSVTAEEISGTSENSIKSTEDEISRRNEEHVENKASAEGNFTDPQNDVDELTFSCNLCHQRFSKERYLAAHAYMRHEDLGLENELLLKM